MVGGLLKKAKKLTKWTKAAKKKRDLKNARARVLAAEERAHTKGNPRKIGHTSKRMKELMKKGTLGKIDEAAKKGTGIFIGQKNPGRGVGRWDYRRKK
jgi:hypothetical protein|tara:strand:+ start:135 stop:428 length:294 start_codon:yes stop_codon:yes gene_type:complete